MANRRRILGYALGGVALTVLVGSIAIAAAPGGGRDGMAGRGFIRLMEEMDADRNGAVSRTEIEDFNAARAAAMDADGNGGITVAELEAYRDAQRQKRMAAHLAAMDSNGDGKVSVEELQAAANWRLARLDRDGDGSIERDELGRRNGGHRGPGAEGAPFWQED